MNSRPRYDVQVNTDWLLALMTVVAAFALIAFLAIASQATTATVIWGSTYP